MSNDYKARIRELCKHRTDQMLESFGQQVVRAPREFFTLCAPILTSDANHGVSFVLDE